MSDNLIKMKKTLILMACLSVFISCKKDVKSKNSEDTIINGVEKRTAKQSDKLTLLKGEFVY